jgi:hypothetical protein
MRGNADGQQKDGNEKEVQSREEFIRQVNLRAWI